MYDERLASAIFNVLYERFPDKLQVHDLKAALPQFSGVADQDWLRAIDGLQAEGQIDGKFLRGRMLHLSTMAAKFRDRRWIVEEINVCEHRWCIERFGTLTIVEGNGHRWCECRPNSKHVRHTAAVREPVN